MLKLAAAALTVLFAACYAQPPKVEIMIPETFMARFEISVHGHGVPVRKGEGSWERSETLEDYRRIDRFVNESGTTTYEHLGLFRTHVEYSIENTKCEKREIPEDRTFPLIWQDFVKDGHFLGRRTIHIGNTTVDVYVWALQYHDGGAELWTKIPEGGMEVKEPFAMERRDHYGIEAIVFSSFLATNPPESVFTPPSMCNMRSTTHQRKPNRL